ncbi:MAG: universal stress protein [Cyclobacteriaceae bacterium]
MKQILVPTDFSERAKCGVKSAVSLAGKSKGIIELLHVSKGQENQDLATAQFRKWRSSGLFGDAEVFLSLGFGDLVSAIRGVSADVIVMGSHMMKGARSFFGSSNAERVSKRADCPVITVKCDTDLANVKNIVYPTDMRIDQEELIGDIKALQKFYGAKISLVKIFDDTVNKHAAVEKRLKEFALQYALEDYDLTALAYLNEREGILQYAHEIKADMIAMATHNRAGLDRLIGGYISGGVVKEGNMAIWTKVVTSPY